MIHYINLLEPAECHYLGSAEQNPLYKLGGVALVVAFLAWNVFNYQAMRATIRESAEVTRWLEENEEAVSGAKDRIARQLRMDKARISLNGWRTSRYDYPAMFSAMARGIPEPADQMQFTLLYFNERMIGMSTPRENPGEGQSEFFPLERRVSIELKGRVANERPDLTLDAYKARLGGLGADLPFRNITMRLEERVALDNTVEESDTITPFSAEFELNPRELRP